MRLIDADALKAEWYRLNDINEEDRGARFVGYSEIARLIDNALTVEPTGDLISRADAIEAVAEEWLSEASAESPYVNDDDIGAYRTLAENLFKDVPSAETHEIRTETHGVCLISKDDAMGAVQDHFNANGFKGYDDGQKMMDRIKALPSADATIGDYPNDLISRSALMEYCSNQKSKTIDNNDIARFPSAYAEQGYTEWLEKIIVDNEGANEWLCEDTPDLEWCEKNCHYTSIQAECLRHLYEVSKGGARMEANK